ncbi:agrin-like [Mercenaria mercenaria]|uniref:agrin-like n=1 Tax=Mercenaria mercenaria TaxID=6596 RepID=UPI00234E8935|nr:agrin-like [Mercenaria mercenaria]
MIKLILFTVGICIVGAITDPTQLCNELMALDCKVTYIKGEKDETVCGTNGQTYNNFCYYGQARCRDKTIRVAFQGPCSAPLASILSPVSASSASSAATDGPVVTGTTLPPTTDPIHDAFCGNKNDIVCGTDLAPICGSDKQIYLNKCRLLKVYCDDKSLTSQPIEFCTGIAVGRK